MLADAHKKGMLGGVWNENMWKIFWPIVEEKQVGIVRKQVAEFFFNYTGGGDG